MGNYSLFGEACQATQDLNYDHQFFGYPPALSLENTLPFFKGNILGDPFVRSPQHERRAPTGLGGLKLRRLPSSTASHPSIKSNEPILSVEDTTTEPSAIWLHSLSSTPSTDNKGQYFQTA
ncbi:hypothetical protein N7485_012394 [Penicillium canescens]|nr:hypothetical protein N7485_012394 [Penicillium canescens]